MSHAEGSGALSAFFIELEGKMRALYPRIAFGYGKKDLDRNDLAPPRIVWVPTEVDHDAAVKQKTNPRSLLTRKAKIVAHCWAAAEGRTVHPLAHFDACEELVHDLIVQLHTLNYGSIAMGGEQWLESANADLGHAALVTFTLSKPVVDKTYRTVKITSIQANTSESLAGDNNVDWGEP